MAAGKISYNYGPSDKVWVIYNQACEYKSRSSLSRVGPAPGIDGFGVMEGTVIYFRVDVLQTKNKMVYGINLKGTDKTRDFHVDDVFGSLAEALVSYEYRILGNSNTNNILNTASPCSN